MLAKQLLITDGLRAEEREDALVQGKDVLLFGTEPFQSLPTTFRIALAGHPAIEGVSNMQFVKRICLSLEQLMGVC